MIHLIQLGLGGVGRELARQVLAQQEILATRYGIDLQYRGLVDSSGALISENGLRANQIEAAIEAKTHGQRLIDLPAGLPAIAWERLLSEQPCIIIDVTAADGQGPRLIAAGEAGHRVVLANKKPLTEEFASFQALTSHGATRYEATVGAGLPVIATLQNLLDSGDHLIQIEAALSGTLGYLCSELERGVAFSQAVRTAHQLGYTEPDPRDDLSGMDVARKALIIGRSAGFGWAKNAVSAEPLFPPAFGELSREEFLAKLEDLDEPMAERLAAVKTRNEVLRYAATITPTGATIGLIGVARDHPLASLAGPDNLVRFSSERYRENALVVRGPGAGQSVTAAGVLGDVIACGRELRFATPR